MGPSVVLFYGLYLESYKVIPKRFYLGAYGYRVEERTLEGVFWFQVPCRDSQYIIV